MPLHDPAASRFPRASHGSTRDLPEQVDVLVVGAGLAGCVMAERLASQRGARVLVVDRRDHVGGNAHDRLDAHGVRIHPYGPHVFHTNSDDVVDYLSAFTAWRPYEHRVLANVEGRLLPFPINIDTINRLHGLALDASTVQAWLDGVAETPPGGVRTSEDSVVSRVGRTLYETFFRGYTRKQWGLDPSQLDASVAARIPVRPDHDDRYFTDRFQAMPAQGYASMFQAMLDHRGIRVVLGTDYREIARAVRFRHLVYTGPIDAFFDERHGKLPYRSLRFEHEHRRTPWVQSVGTINFPGAEPYTRITEFKHLTGQSHAGTSLVREYPCADGDPYYPIPRPENAARYERYRDDADRLSNVTFVGRLASYRYYNMDQVVAQALATFRRLPPIAALPPVATLDDERVAAAVGAPLR